LLEQVKNLLFRALQEKLYAKVQGRIYPAELATIERPNFPCICFRLVGGVPHPLKSVATVDVALWIWSKKSYSEALSIYEDLKNVLHSQLFRSNGVASVFYETSIPVELFDPAGELYYIATRYSARTLEG